MVYISIKTWHQLIARLLGRVGDVPISGVFGVPRGGSLIAVSIATTLGIPLLSTPQRGCLVVDDLIDSGTTKKKYVGYLFEALIDKRTDDEYHGKWIDFWYEKKGEDDKDLVIRIAERLEVDLNDIINKTG